MKQTTLTWTPGTGWSAALPDADSASTLVLLFGDDAVASQRQVVDEVVRAFPSSVVTGCSTSGQILGPCLMDNSWVVAVVAFEKVRLSRVSAGVSDSGGSFRAGEALGHGLRADDLRAVFVLSDGLHVNGSELVAGLAEAVGPDVVITGGLAGDGDRFGETWVLEDGALVANRVMAVGLHGEALRIATGSQGGWGIFGPERVVTRSSGNVLFELDHKPALELYRRYLGDLASGLPASALLFPLAVRPATGGPQLVRTVLAVDEAVQSMTFAGDIPTGWRAQLMRSNTDRLVDGAASAALASTKAMDAGSTMSIAISCVGRRLVLGERTEEEIEAVLEVLPGSSGLVGFYSYGEIAPGETGRADLHNQTMTITTIGEVMG